MFFELFKIFSKTRNNAAVDIFVDFSADNLLGKVPKLFRFWVSFTNLESKGGKIETIEIEN